MRILTDFLLRELGEGDKLLDADQVICRGGRIEDVHIMLEHLKTFVNKHCIVQTLEELDLLEGVEDLVLLL